MKKVAICLCAVAAITLLLVAPPAASASLAPQLHYLNNTSSGWAGWAATSPDRHFFSEVESFWKVPAATDKTRTLFVRKSLDWVGIDGWRNDHIIQVGTGVTVSPLTGITYYAWYETAQTVEQSKTGNFHKVSPELMSVKPGNLIEAAIEEVSANQWEFYVANLTVKQVWSKLVSFDTPGMTVEAVHENPVGSNSLESTANVEFVSTTFNHYGIGTLESLPNLFPHVILYRIRMVDDGKDKATPSLLNGSCFTVADGSTAPEPPSCLA